MTDREKLAVCIDTLRLISGDPANDRQDVGITPAMRVARRALARIGASMEAPIKQRMDQ